MNNADFRILLGESSRGHYAGNGASGGTCAPNQLGIRSRKPVSLMPRNVRGFTQLVPSDAGEQPNKTFKSAAAPKGSRLGSGYTDRALERQSGTSDSLQDYREARLKALEEQLKLGQIDIAAFETQRDVITGGDITATHLVKGLDRRLLERVRRGEDVLAASSATAVSGSSHSPPQNAEEDRDAEFEVLELRDIAPVQSERVEKKGERAPLPNDKTGIKRSRADLLAELKALRQADPPISAPFPLSSRFSKISSQKPSTRVEDDGSGREVLITVDADGRMKRKVKKRIESQSSNHLLMPSTNAQPLGMVVYTRLQKPGAEREDVDIFENVGSAYNPLGNEEEVDAGSSSDEERLAKEPRQRSVDVSPGRRGIALVDHVASPADMKGPKRVSASPNSSSWKRDYFGGLEVASEGPHLSNPLRDPTILSALHRAAALELKRSGNSQSIEAQQATKGQKQLLASSHDRDLDDMDLGFGSSRFDDDDDDGDPASRMKLSEWRSGLQTEDIDDAREAPGASKRKRGKKKHKGDKNSAADIFRVIEGRKARAT